MAVTWDPSNTYSGYTLSNGNLTAYLNSGSSSGYTQATVGYSSGKYYWEIIAATAPTLFACLIGNSQPSPWFSSTPPSNIVYWAKSGTVAIGSTALAAVAGYTSGNRLCIAVDITNGLSWYKVGAGNWNNSATANPATGIGGISWSAYLSGIVFAGLSMGQPANSGTAAFLASSFSYPAPSGFSAYDPGSTAVASDAAVAAELSAAARKDAWAPGETRSPAPAVSARGGGGASSRPALGRAAYARGPLAPVSSAGTAVTSNAAVAAELSAMARKDAVLRDEALAAQLRTAGTDAGHPAVNHASSLATGMVGAYFPGYGAPVVDATGTWLPLTVQTNGSAGTLVNMPGFGPAMQFDGLYNGLWASRSDMPVNPALTTNLTMALVVNVLGPTHNYGAGLCICSSNPTNDGQRQHLGWFLNGNPSGEGQFVTNGAGTATLLDPTVRTMPTGLAVLLCTLSGSPAGAGPAVFYVNGIQVATTETEGFTTLDTVALGCRAQAPGTVYETGFSVTSGSPTITGTVQEDTIIGSPVTDSLGYIPAGTVVLNYDSDVTYTLSQNATGTSSSDSVLFGVPETRLANCQIGVGVLWNRVLTAAEIASFSADPLTPFFMPIVGDPPLEIGAGVIEDTPVRVESLATGITAVTDNSTMPLEELAGVVGDAATAEEAAATQAANTTLPVENTGAAAVIGDQLAPIEIAVRIQHDALLAAEIERMLRGDGAAPMEAIGAAVTAGRDSNGLLEVLSGVRNDLDALAELLQRTRADPALTAEIVGRSAADSALPSESIGQAITILDGLITLETNIRQGTDAMLGNEALPLAVIDALAVIGSWSTPLPRLAVGRLLRSTGKRRLLPG